MGADQLLTRRNETWEERTHDQTENFLRDRWRSRRRRGFCIERGVRTAEDGAQGGRRASGWLSDWGRGRESRQETRSGDERSPQRADVPVNAAGRREGSDRASADRRDRLRSR